MATYNRYRTINRGTYKLIMWGTKTQMKKSQKLYGGRVVKCPKSVAGWTPSKSWALYTRV